ncbi:MAG TPA: YIP1 family protein [Acidobacteriaceae bacterium]|nr:YIP1 family protein [Acidobacteriaceae bacterium]
MADALAPDTSVQPLNEMQRIVDTFAAPSKLGKDIVRSAAWWGPFIILVIVSIGFSFTVQKKIGWAAVYDNAISQNPKMKQMIENLPADQQVVARQKGIARQPYTAYAAPVFSLIFTAIFALLIWPTINFGFGGTAKFSKIFAVLMYSNIISYGVRFLLAVIAIFAGLSPESFNFQNPVGTNLGYYLVGSAPLWLVTMGSFIDIFGIWSMVVSSIGCGIVARVKTSSAAIAVFGWWLLFMLGITGLVAAFS